MTNGSGPTQPPGPRPTILSGAAEQSARAVRLPDMLSDVGRALRLEGEVLQQNQDGTTRVRTVQGDVDLQVRGRQPQPGQLLEIDVPAGRPPRQVTIRSAPQTVRTTADDPAVQARIEAQVARAAQIAQNAAANPSAPIRTPTTGPTTPQAALQTAPTNAGPSAQGSAPRPIPVAPLPAQAATPPAPQPAPLPPGSVVRLLPVSPAQAQQIVQATAQTLTSLPTQVARIAFSANLIAQSVQNNNTAALLQLRAPDIAALSQAVQKIPLAQLQPGPALPPSMPAAPGAAQVQQLLTLLSSSATGTPALTTQHAATTNLSLTQQALPGTPSGAFSMLITTSSEGAFITGQTSAFARITQLDVRVLNIQSPQITLSAPSADGKVQGLPVPGTLKIIPPVNLPQTSAGTLTAQVTGVTAQNLPLVTLQWPGSALPQSFILQFNASGLPVGSQITFQPQNMVMAQPGTSGAVSPITAGTTTLPPALLSLFGPGPWPIMDEAYQTMLQVSPQAAQALARSLPSPANAGQLGPAALLFIAAVRSGDIGSWLGDKKIDALQRSGKDNLLSRLTQDLSSLAQRTTDSKSATGEWRAVPLPLFWEGEIHKIALYVKDDGGSENNEQSKEKQTRFIFDLDLNRMGGVQLDGLVRADRFDLVVRTQTPLSGTMQQAMRYSYSQALQDTELHGDLSFQGDIKNWINVLQQNSQFGASA